ncbi:MAG: hypothetical protein ACM3OB_02225 [Acidobacteriota bacterium]
MPGKNVPRRDWYHVSVDTLRGWLYLLLVVVMVAVGYFGFRYWSGVAVERDALGAIDEARVLAQRLQREPGLDAYREEYGRGWDSLQEARTAYERGDYRPARDSGRRSRDILQGVLDALANKGTAGEAQFISVQGGVEYRRGESGDWEEARSRLLLRSGDFVKTSATGSAEIMFLNGTLYTVRPNTLFVVTRTRTSSGAPGEQAIRMEYGWVNLNTAERPGKITTPTAEARIKEESEATVTYDTHSGAGRFAAYRGGVEVETRGGQKRAIAANQQVVQTGAVLSDVRTMPTAPTPLEPANGVSLSVERDKQVALTWEAVPGATRYALQISRNRLFVDNVIDVDNRTKTRATLALRGDGTFLWRVAALGKDGAQGAWSAPRELRVVSVEQPDEAALQPGDHLPPALELDNVKSYGSLFILAGRTRPGSTVLVNGEAVAVAADGSFTKTVQINKEGWSFVEVRARDAEGNETVRRHRVFVESL